MLCGIIRLMAEKVREAEADFVKAISEIDFKGMEEADEKLSKKGIPVLYEKRKRMGRFLPPHPVR